MDVAVEFDRALMEIASERARTRSKRYGCAGLRR